MYIFIDAHTIEAYNGEILKRYVGKKLVKAISNPTDEQLREFGYKPLDDTAEMPEYNETTQYIAVKYTDTPEKIIKGYIVYDIEILDESELSNVQEVTNE